MDSKDSILVIDFCGTLVLKQTANRFVYFAMEKNILNIFKYYMLFFLEKAFAIFKKWKIPYRKIDKENYLKILKDYKEEELEIKAKEYIVKLEKYTNHALIDFINKHFKNEKKIIASAGYGIYIKYFIKYFHFDSLLASEIVFDNGECTGKCDRSVYGEDKKNYFISEYPNFSMYKIIFFSDSISDLPLFELANYSYVIKPNKRMKKYAKREKHEIID